MNFTAKTCGLFLLFNKKQKIARTSELEVYFLMRLNRCVLFGF